MKRFKQFLLEEDNNQENESSNEETPSDNNQPGKRKAKEIDKDYKDAKYIERWNPEAYSKPSLVPTSKGVNPNPTSAEDDYNYWKGALVGKNSNPDADKMYDWMWRTARQDQYPWEKQKREDAQKKGTRYYDDIKPQPWESPVEPKQPSKEEQQKEINKAADQENRDAVKGVSKEDEERIVKQAREDREQGKS